MNPSAVFQYFYMDGCRILLGISPENFIQFRALTAELLAVKDQAKSDPVYMPGAQIKHLSWQQWRHDVGNQLDLNLSDPDDVMTSWSW